MFPQSLHIATLFWLFLYVFCNHHSRLNLDSAQEDKAHLKQHVSNGTDVDNMPVQDVRFNFFKFHDTNQDFRLDGQEIIKAILHYQDEVKPESRYVFSDEDIGKFLDPVLDRDDKNNDGFLDYLEFMAFRYVS